MHYSSDDACAVILRPMALLFDYLPIIVFFIAYKVTDIYVATGVLIVALFMLVIGYWVATRKVHKMHLITAVLALIFGGLTIAVHDPTYIKAKPSVLYLLFAVVLLASRWIGKKPIIQRMLEKNIQLPRFVWLRLNSLWVIFFVICAVLNAYVAYNYDNDTWVNFKMFGMLGLTLLFVVAQGFYLARHLPDEENESH
jgi:intracellular septation protein